MVKKKTVKKKARGGVDPALGNGRVRKVTVAAAPAPKEEKKGLVISPPNMETAVFAIVGTAPYVQNKFSTRIKQDIMRTQAAGSTARSKKKRDAKNFQALYKEAMHVSKQGWCGIPAPAFRAAMIDACRLVGFKMVLGKLSVFVKADGYDVDDATPLVRLYGKPRPHEGHVRNATGVIDIRVRPMWEEWKAVLTVRFDRDQFTAADVGNLLLRAGTQVGIGEGRPNSKQSYGQGWGTFEIELD